MQETYVFSNFATAHLVYEAEADAPVLFVTPGESENMPWVEERQRKVFPLVLSDGHQDEEIVTVVRNPGNGGLIVRRGQEGTTAKDWAAGTFVRLAPTAAFLNTLPDGRDILLEASRYTYIAYADEADGSGFTTRFDPNKAYVAVLVSHEPIDTPNIADFEGLWMGFRGGKGDKGDRGEVGPRGPEGAKGDKGDKGDRGTEVPAGSVVLAYRKNAPDGWIIHDEGTIGNSTSGASTLADETAHDLFLVLWDFVGEVLDNRGETTSKSANAQSDWDASRRIKLPEKDGMALAASGGNFRAGEVGGRESFQLEEKNIPRHRFRTVGEGGGGDNINPGNPDKPIARDRNFSDSPQNYTLTDGGNDQPTLGVTNYYGKENPDSISLRPRSAFFNLLIKL